MAIKTKPPPLFPMEEGIFVKSHGYIVKNLQTRGKKHPNLIDISATGSVC